MFTVPFLQISLAGLITLTIISDFRRQRLYSAFLLTSLVMYLYYSIAVDWQDVYHYIPASGLLGDGFAAFNLLLVAMFFGFFQAGRAVFGVLQPYRGQNANFTVPIRASKISVLISLCVGVSLIGLSADGWWVFNRYPLNKGQFALLELGGAGPIANIFILFAIHRSLSVKAYRRFSNAILILICAHYVLAGDRGSLLFLLVGYYCLRLQSRRRLGLKDLAEALILGTILVLFLQLIAEMRAHIYAIAAEKDAPLLEEINNLPQAVAHTYFSMMIVSLDYDFYSHGPIDFLLRLALQMVPSAILSAFGFELYNGPWRLAEFFRHNGGFFVPAELYSVSGLSSLVLLSFYIGFLSGINDLLGRRASDRKDTLILMLVLIAAASNLYTIFYGAQGLNRMLTLPLLVYTARRLLRIF